MSRVYGLKRRDLRAMTIPELDAYRADLMSVKEAMRG
jgi:hypothetical protein